ncbi:MAG: polysaccharide biosynthesis tyrosine autokinase [Lentisphaerae bacterium]|nr:polysaccharide biosynthesis tyrosine autokinase [Lentisphaerota bacterium]
MVETQESTTHFLDYWRVVCARKEIVIAVLLLVVMGGVGISYLLPRVYTSSTVIAVREAETPDLPVFTREGTRFNPLFLRTQFEIIQSRPIVEETVRRLKLEERLGIEPNPRTGTTAFEAACRGLASSMRVQQYRDTNLIQIRAFLSEPKGAAHELVADVANEIAAVFRDERMKNSLREKEDALKALHSSLLAQEDKVRTAERRVEDIRQKYKIDFYGRGEVTLDQMGLTALENERVRTRMELAEKEARYAKIQTLTAQELLSAAPYLVGDPALAALVERRRSAEVDLSQVKEMYGPNHPDFIRRKSAVDEISAKISEALDGLKVGVSQEYEAAKNKYRILETELDGLKARERNATSSEYREFNQAQQDLDHAKQIRDVLETRYIQEKIEMDIPRTTVEVIERAVAPGMTEAVSPNLLMIMILSIVMGIGAGVGLAFFIEYMDTSVKTIDEVEQVMGVPVLGVIPRGVRPLVSEDSEPGHAEAYRVLRTNIQFSKKLAGAKTITCTSASVGEGKSLTIFNLAYVCAGLGDRTLIVDSDLHRPRQHKILGLSNEVGLTDVLMDKSDLDSVIQATPVPNLSFLPSGRMTTQAHGLLDTRRMKDLVGEVRARFDMVFFDAPPIIGVSDASLLAREIDGVLLVIQHRKYPRALSQRARNMLSNAGANLIGVVLNNINISRDYSYYYYHYTSSRYYNRPASQAGRK